MRELWLRADHSLARFLTGVGEPRIDAGVAARYLGGVLQAHCLGLLEAAGGGGTTSPALPRLHARRDHKSAGAERVAGWPPQPWEPLRGSGKGCATSVAAWIAPVQRPFRSGPQLVSVSTLDLAVHAAVPTDDTATSTPSRIRAPAAAREKTYSGACATPRRLQSSSQKWQQFLLKRS